MSVNKFMGIGALGQDPELKFLPSGSAVCNFSIAVNDTWVDKQGQKQERTEWINVVTYKNLAETCNKFLTKGSKVFVEGKMQTRTWDDKDGKKCYMTEINAHKVEFLSPKKQVDGNVKEERDYNIQTNNDYTADTIPF